MLNNRKNLNRNLRLCSKSDHLNNNSNDKFNNKIYFRMTMMICIRKILNKFRRRRLKNAEMKVYFRFPDQSFNKDQQITIDRDIKFLLNQ